MEQFEMVQTLEGLAVRGLEQDVQEAIAFLLEHHYWDCRRYCEEESGYGLVFQVCGYDGQAQESFRHYMHVMFGVEVV